MLLITINPKINRLQNHHYIILALSQNIVLYNPLFYAHIRSNDKEYRHTCNMYSYVTL
jgi:hypothetical protein